MSSTAREFLRLRSWVEWQDGLTAEGRSMHPWLLDLSAKLKRDAAYLIGWMA